MRRAAAPAGEIEHVRVRIFAAADGLATVIPETTEEAQYSLVWPLACALVHGRFGVDDVLGPFSDPDVRAVFDRIEVEVDPELTAAFPERRLTAVEIELADGRRLQAGPLEAPGEPEDPELPGIGGGQGSAPVGRPAGRTRRQLALRAPAGSDAEQLLALMCDAAPVAAGA